MAATTFGLNDALAVKLWQKKLSVEALKYTALGPLIGDDANSIIQRKVETSKSAGDKITYGLRTNLSGRGFTENEIAEGNGESLSIYSDSLVINELGNVVATRSQNTIDQQRVPFDLRENCMDALAQWFAKRMSVSFFNQVCGNTAVTDTVYTGMQSTVEPSSGRVLWAGSRTADESLTSSDTFNLQLIDKAKEAALVASPMVRPIMVGKKKRNTEGVMVDDYDGLTEAKYVMYLHPYQVTDLRTNTSTGQWLDISKAAMTGGEVTNNPIYTGALGEYNGVILRQAFDLPAGINSSTGAIISSTRRAVMLGAQSAAIAFGQKSAANNYRWNEELFDHKRSLEVSAWTIWGMKKIQFNSVDFGTIVVPTYAAAHT